MKKLLTIAMIFLPLIVVSQFNTNWIFGFGYGLDFSNEEVLGFQVEDFYQFEGSASVSDTSGNLVLYCDGTKIYGINGQAISDQVELYGGSSCTNSAVILPIPFNKDKYYVITINDLSHPTSSSNNGIGYNVVQISGSDNGDIEYDLLSSNFIMNEVGEKMAISTHGNGHDYWLVARGEGSYFVFLVDSMGISLAHSFPSAIELSRDTNMILQDFGQIKFSPIGGKIAVNLNVQGNDVSESYIEIFDFNPCTGEMSSGVLSPLFSGREWSYGLEWSSDEKFLYQSHLSSINGKYYLTRTKPNPDFLFDTLYSSSFLIGGLQIAQDSHIYVACTDIEIYDGASVSRLERIDEEDFNDVIFYKNVVRFDNARPWMSFPIQVPTHVEIQDGFTLGNDTSILLSQFPWTLHIKNHCGFEVLWEDGSSGLSRTIDQPGQYSASTICNCQIVNDTIHILSQEIEERIVLSEEDDTQECVLQFPLAFSPNGDGLDDTFVPYVDNMECIDRIENYQLKIYDFSGKLVCISSSVGEGWEAFNTNQQEVYLYQCKYRINDNTYEVSGDVSIVK